MTHSAPSKDLCRRNYWIAGAFRGDKNIMIQAQGLKVVSLSLLRSSEKCSFTFGAQEDHDACHKYSDHECCWLNCFAIVRPGIGCPDFST